MTPGDRGEMRAALLEVLAETAPEVDPQTLDPDAPLREQIDLDSFDFLTLVQRLHQRLGIDIPERDYPSLRTLNGAVDYLAGRSGD